MNPREKVLAACVIGLLAVGGSWIAIKWGVIDRWRALQSDVNTTAEREEHLKDRLDLARMFEERWVGITPLSHNPEVGALRFREDISKLLDDHGLGGGDCTIQDSPPRTLKTSVTDTEFTEVRVRVTAKGTLTQVVDFLCDFYRRQYPARVDRMSLSTASQSRRLQAVRRGRRGSGRPEESGATTPGSNDPNGPELNVTMTVTALVLPEDEAGKLVQNSIEDPTPDPERPWRLQRERKDYDVVIAKNLFREGPAPTQVVSASKEDDEPKQEPTRPVITPPKARPEKTLIATTSTDGVLEAYVRDEKRRELPPERLQLNDPVDDGTLVLVFQRGMVVQVPDERKDTTDFKYYVYKLGGRFSERELLDPARYPELRKRLDECLASK